MSFKVAAHKDRGVFVPFVLNIKIDTKESIYELLKPFIYSRPGGEPTPITFHNTSKEQRNWAEDMCSLLSEIVPNIER